MFRKYFKISIKSLKLFSSRLFSNNILPLKSFFYWKWFWFCSLHSLVNLIIINHWISHTMCNGSTTRRHQTFVLWKCALNYFYHSPYGLNSFFFSFACRTTSNINSTAHLHIVSIAYSVVITVHNCNIAQCIIMQIRSTLRCTRTTSKQDYFIEIRE